MFDARILFAPAVVLVGCSPRATDPARPDVILITLDTVRADHLSSYGYALPTTPSLDALAADGVRFEQCAATASLTPVSHASILTGLNPYRHGLRVLHAQNGAELEPDVPTLATVLEGAGYATGAILSAYPVSETFGFARGFDHFDNGMLPEGADRKARNDADERERKRVRGPRDEPRAGTQRRSDATIDAALEWIERADRPAFAWIHLWDVHDPILVPPADAVRDFQRAATEIGGRAPELYDVELAFLDQQLGRLFARLRELDRYDDALIVVTSDHGEGLGEHGWFAHRLLYEEQLHVPLILKLPRGPRGLVVPQLVRTIDLFPTVLEVVDLAAPEPVEGASLVELTRTAGSGVARVAYADQLNKWDAKADMLEQRPQDDLLHSLRAENWKLIYRPLRPETSELYDLASDPEEARNLYGERGEQAKLLLEQLNVRDPWVLRELGPGALDDHAADALRELGYIGDEEH